VKINVLVTPKRNVLDPQGAAVGHALESLGFHGLKSVRVGKLQMCRDLLSNPVIEDFRYEIQ